MPIANPKLKAETEVYFAKLRNNPDVDVTHYDCPHCGETLPTRASPRGEVWDTLAACYGCDGLHWKVTDGWVITTVTIPGDAE